MEKVYFAREVVAEHNDRGGMRNSEKGVQYKFNKGDEV